MIEMWGTATLDAQTPGLWANNLYYKDVAITWPGGIFESNPSGVMVTGNNSQWIVVGTIGSVSTTGISVRLARPTDASYAISLKVYAIKYPG